MAPRAPMKLTIFLILLVALSIPMSLNMVPRNGFYGFRTPRTLASDEVWYPANSFAGKALLIAGLAWAASWERQSWHRSST